MPEPELNDTQPNSINEDTQPNRPEPGGKKNFPRWLPLVFVVLLVVVGLLSGYASGMGVRYSTQATQVSGQLADQFKLGQQAFEAGQYVVAQQHYDFVMQHNPNFPGIQAAYSDLLLKMHITPTEALTPTSSASPTVDLRGADEQFKNAQDLLKAGDWSGAISMLDTLRKGSPTYQTVQVDGMYYTALYERGYTEIRPQSCRDTNLSAGIIDFTMAEHFGPLDTTADTLRTYSRLYIAGSSFWDQNWKQAQDLFAQVMAAYPTLMDASCITASDRWRQATIKYADELTAKGDSCGASEQYNDAFRVNSPDNEAVYPTATAVANQCNGGGNGGGGPQPTLEVTLTPTTPAPTPAVETPTNTPVPSNTPVPPPPSETPTTGG